MRLFGPWASCAINLKIDTSGVEYHNDSDDCINGFCWLIPFGDYDGAHLLFPELAIALEAKPGDVICFKSKLLLHGTTNFTGSRKSLVLFSNNSIFFPSEK